MEWIILLGEKYVQVYKSLREHIRKHRLFLVVDNVWNQQNSIQEANSFLSLPFKNGSVVLVTARSLEILNIFKKTIRWKDCFLTPFLHKDAATKLFLNSAGYKLQADLESKDQASKLSTFVDSCYFSMPGFMGREYHPLALKVLGAYVGQYTGSWENIKIDFKSIGENEKIDPLFSVLEIGWETLSTNYRNLFLDLVQFITHYGEYGRKEMVQIFLKWYSIIFAIDGKKICDMVRTFRYIFCLFGL